MGMTTHNIYEGLSAEDKARIAITNAFACNPGDFHERFRVAKVIGYGSNGVVLAAQDLTCTSGFSAVAIKIIYKERTGRLEKLAPPEIQILRDLAAAGGSPHIVHTIADWQDLNHYYLVTELFGQSWIECADSTSDKPRKSIVFKSSHRGHTFTHNMPFYDGSSDLWAYAHASRTHLERTEGHRLLPIDPCKHIIKQVASALLFMHQEHYYHGDVKMENILVSQVEETTTTALRTRLADFGHARAVEAGILSYGTRAIAPPEFLEDGRVGMELDGRCSDVFALGMVMFGLLNDEGLSSPKLPQGCTKYERLLTVDGGKYPITGISDLDADGWHLLHAMCRVDPSQRITMRQVVNHPWLQDVHVL